MPDHSDASASKSQETGYLPGDDSWTRWRNFFTILAGQMSYEGKLQYKKARDIRYEAADVKRVEGYRPIIRFMRENIWKLNGDINEDNVRCVRCTNFMAGGFSADYGIVICANYMKNQSHVEDTLAHEMIHAYDHLRFKVDWSNDLRHAACTEIRASMLSGECRFAREFFTRGQRKITQQFQECVRRRAVSSIVTRPACRDHAHAVSLVNGVWDSCFADTRPFDEIYK